MGVLSIVYISGHVPSQGWGLVTRLATNGKVIGIIATLTVDYIWCQKWEYHLSQKWQLRL